MVLNSLEKQAMKTYKHNLEENNLVSFYYNLYDYFSTHCPLNDYIGLGNVTRWLLEHDIDIISYWQGTREILPGMFRKCDIDHIEIPATVEAINSHAFSGCTSLKDVAFSKSSELQYIGREAFYRCGSLKSIHIPEGVTHIGLFAFGGCHNLEEIYLPSTIVEISNGAFDTRPYHLLTIYCKFDPEDISWDDYKKYNIEKI